MIAGAESAMSGNIQRAKNVDGGERATISKSILSSFSRKKSGRD
jgi:hypothetical protein